VIPGNIGPVNPVPVNLYPDLIPENIGPVNPVPAPVIRVPSPVPAPVIRVPSPVPAPVIRVPSPVPVNLYPDLIPENIGPVSPVPVNLYPDLIPENIGPVSPVPAPVIRVPSPVPAPVIRGRVPANLYPDHVPVIRVPSPVPAPVADVPVDEMHIPRSLHATRGMEFVPYSLKPSFLRYNGPSLLYRKIYEHTENYPEFNRRFAQLLLNDNIIFYPTRPAGSDTASESETWSDSGSSSRSPSRSRSGSDSGSDTAEASNSARPTMTTMLRLNPEVQAALRNIFNDMP
jgi:hypothetical protein